MAEAASNQQVCGREDCQENAIKFCKMCQHCLCTNHNKVHDEFIRVVKTPHNVITVEEYRRTVREENSKCYTQHQEATTFVACQPCHKPVCSECMGDRKVKQDFTFTDKDDAEMFAYSFQTEDPTQPLCGKQVYETPTVRVPTNLELKFEIDGQSARRCVQYSQTGALLHSGDYSLSGLDFVPSLPRKKIISLYEHKSLLYVLQILSGNYHVHVINLDNQSIDQSVITFPSNAYCTHMYVTDKHVLITNWGSSAIKVYSSTIYDFLFNIRDTTLFSRPHGLAAVGDTLIVGEWGWKSVISMTINQTPEMKWKTSIGKLPNVIEVKDTYQIIFVGFSNSISILSYQGEKLKTFDTLQCSKISHMSCSGNHFAVADGTDKIKVYEMKFENR